MPDRHPPTCRIGTSGYQHDHWRSVFYPDDLPKKRWFEYYAERFDTVEINNTFYRLPEPATFDDWHRRAPKGFRYALKFSRYGSHMKKLKGPDDTIGLFLERAERLEACLGPILVQLPPHWNADPRRLSHFLDRAPRRRRWAVEFREGNWLCDEVYRVLQSHDAALCIHDMIADHPRRLTTDWTYLRFHGDRYAGAYTHQALSAWAGWIRERMADGMDVYAYFNNDAEGHAVEDARSLRRYVFGERASS